MPANNIDQLVPDPVVWREFGISSMTLFRWTHDVTLGFPPPIKISGPKGKNFRSRAALEEFKERMVRSAIEQRNAKRSA